MKKVSRLMAGLSLLLIMALVGCGYAKKDEIDKRIGDLEQNTNQKIQLAHEAAIAASDKADKSLESARAEIGKVKEEVNAVQAKNTEGLKNELKSSMEAGDIAVKRAAEEAAAKALSDAKAVAIAEDEKVKQAAKAAADKAMGAAEEADRKARKAAEEAELAKTLPKPKVPTVFAVYFELGQTKIDKDGMAELERAANEIKARPGAIVKIEGHTDNIPVIRAKYGNNWALSQARAQAVKDHLVKNLGVPTDSIKETVGLAFYKPAAPNDAQGRKFNRRVEVIIQD